MSPRKYAFAAGLLVAAIVSGFTQAAHGQERGGAVPARPEVGGAFKSADLVKGTITITTVTEGRGGREERVAPTTAEKTFSLVKNVEVAVASRSGGAGLGRGGDSGFLFKEAKLTDLAAGVRVMLTLAADKETVESIVAEGPTVRGIIKAVDADKKTVTIQLPAQGARERGGDAPAAEEKTYTLTPDAEIAVNDGRGMRFSIKEATVIELAQGAIVTAWLSTDMKQIQSISAEGPTMMGTVKAIDPAMKTLTIVRGAQGRGGDGPEEQKLTVSADAVILLDDGKGRRLSLKQGKLADVPVGATVGLKLGVDQAFVMLIRAEGGTLIGQLKAVDVEKGIVVLAIAKGRDEVEEKSLTLAKGARVVFDGKDITLADLKVGDNAPMIQVRFSLDQGTVQAVNAHTPGRR